MILHPKKNGPFSLSSHTIVSIAIPHSAQEFLGASLYRLQWLIPVRLHTAMKFDIVEPLALGFGSDGWETRWHRKPPCSVSKNVKSTLGVVIWLWKLNFDRFLTIRGCVENIDSITS